MVITDSALAGGEATATPRVQGEATARVDPVLKLEQECLEREVQYFLRTEVPSVFMQLGMMLKETAQFLRPAADPASCAGTRNGTPSSLTSRRRTNSIGAGRQGSPQTLPLTTSSDSLKGYVTIDTDSIVKADLQIRFPRWNKGALFRTSISPAAPRVFPQMKTASNCLNLALTAINNSSLQHGLFHTRSQVRQVLASVMIHLRKAKDALVLTPAFSLEEILSSAQVFKPPLPREIVVDFPINHGHICAAVYLLDTPASNAASGSGHSRASVRGRVAGGGSAFSGGGSTAISSDMFTQAAAVGQIYENRGRLVEVVDYVDVQVPVGRLADALTFLVASQELCQRLQDKATALF